VRAHAHARSIAAAARSSLSAPRKTILGASFGNGRCNGFEAAVIAPGSIAACRSSPRRSPTWDRAAN